MNILKKARLRPRRPGWDAAERCRNQYAADVLLMHVISPGSVLNPRYPSRSQSSLRWVMRQDGEDGLMLTTSDGESSAGGRRDRKRFACMTAGYSSATALFRSCPVVNAVGQTLGRVRSLMVDVRSRQLRYVVVATGQGKAPIGIPWRTLYFDSTRARLVYYTFT